MGLPTTGPLRFSDIQSEFGDTNPIALSEYYAGGANVPSTTISINDSVRTAVPTSSSPIAMGNFLGAAATDHYLITANSRTSISENGTFIETYDNRINGDPEYAQQLRSISYNWANSISLCQTSRHGVVVSGVRPTDQYGSYTGTGAMTYFSYSTTGAINIISTTTPTVQTFKAGADFNPDGNSIAYATGTTNRITFYDHSSPGAITVANQYQLALASQTVQSPRFNPAGNRILFHSGVSSDPVMRRFFIAEYDQVAKNIVNISDPVSVLSGDQSQKGTEFHPTSNIIGIASQAQIFLYSYVGVVTTLIGQVVNPEPPDPVFRVGGASINNFKFAPDGNHIVYVTATPTVEKQTVVRVVDISDPSNITSTDEFVIPGQELGGAWNLEFSNSGRYLWVAQVGTNFISNQGQHFMFEYSNGQLTLTKTFSPFMPETSPVVGAFTPKFLT